MTPESAVHRPNRRIRRELKTLKIMITMACTGNHTENHQGLCNECSDLWEYVKKRTLKCPYGNNKPTCARCPIHCYRPDMRQKIRAVMIYSGPRMILRHPVLTILHGIDGFRRAPSQ